MAFTKLLGDDRLGLDQLAHNSAREIHLNKEEYEFFLRILEEPPREPNEYSRRAAAIYKLGHREGNTYHLPDEETIKKYLDSLETKGS